MECAKKTIANRFLEPQIDKDVAEYFVDFEKEILGVNSSKKES